MSTKRDYGIDLLRIVAGFSLLPFHFCVYGDRHEDIALNYVDTFIKSLSEYHIPLFLMITGALFLKREKLDIKRLYTHNIPHLLLVYIFWSAVYSVFDVLLNLQNVTDIKGLARWMIMDIRDSWYHLWYLPMIIAIYILLPVFHAAFGNMKNTAILRYTVGVFVVFGVMIKTLLLIPVKYDTYSVLLEKIDVGTFAEYIGFVFVGYLLYQEKDRIDARRRKVLAVCSVISLAVIEFVNLSMVPKDGVNTFLLYYPLPCFIVECTLFLSFAGGRYKVSEKTGSVISAVAECILGVYCIHDLVMSLVDMALNRIPDSLYIVRFALVVSISFVLCVVIVRLMRKSRILKWIAV